jgi:site-specific DNA-methyltransferase (adenine-specific)
MIEYFNEDCMIGMARYPDKWFDLAIVDPPYGIGIKGGFGRRKTDLIRTKYDKDVDWDIPPKEDYFLELFRVSANQVIWGGNYFTEYLSPTGAWIIWDKKYGTDQLTFSMAEMAWSSFDTPLKIFYKTNNESFSKKIHPTEKPVALYKWLLTNYAKPGDLILDTHVGSASSLIACHDLGFDAVGFELDEDYYKASKQRLKDHMAQMRIEDMSNHISGEDDKPEQITLW